MGFISELYISRHHLRSICPVIWKGVIDGADMGKFNDQALNVSFRLCIAEFLMKYLQ
jgi:hypothetical protein